MVQLFIMVPKHVLIQGLQRIPEGSQYCVSILQGIQSVDGLVNELHLVELGEHVPWMSQFSSGSDTLSSNETSCFDGELGGGQDGQMVCNRTKWQHEGDEFWTLQPISYPKIQFLIFFKILEYSY